MRANVAGRCRSAEYFLLFLLSELFYVPPLSRHFCVSQGSRRPNVWYCQAATLFRWFSDFFVCQADSQVSRSSLVLRFPVPTTSRAANVVLRPSVGLRCNPRCQTMQTLDLGSRFAPQPSNPGC